MRIARYGKTRYWAVRDTDGALICLCVYRKGAAEVIRRLLAQGKEETSDTGQPSAYMALFREGKRV